MKSKNNNSDQKDLEKKVDEMLYLDSTQSDISNNEEAQNPQTKVLKIDSSSEDNIVTSDDPIKPTLPEEVSSPSSDVQPDRFKETDSAIVSNPPISITKDNLEAEDQDGSVDEIVAREADEVLSVEDQARGALNQSSDNKSKNIFKKKWFYVGCLITILLVIFIIPFSRYKILGFFIKKDIKIEILDSLNKTPVSGAKIFINGKSYLSNGQGDLSLKLSVGYYTLSVKKEYYNSYSSNMLVGFNSNQKDLIKLVANGRRLSLKVLNVITNAPIPTVKITAPKLISFTSNLGEANLVLPASETKYLLNISAEGYNPKSVTLTYSPKDTLQSIKLTPAGLVYYLNQSNGLINVMSSNLDGTSPKILVHGTPSMNLNTTFLFPSSNWQYLVLQTSRAPLTSGLYSINTRTGSMNEFASISNSQSITSLGWINNYFVYEIFAQYNPSSPGAIQVKSYNALNGQNILLDQNQVQGNGLSSVYQQFSFFNIIKNELVYSTQWIPSQPNVPIPTGLNNTLRVVDPNGTNKKDVFSTSAQTNKIDSVIRYLPNALYFGDYSTQSAQPTIYNFVNNAILSQGTSNSNILYNQYPSYQLSSNTFLSAWNQNQNGQISVFWSNQNGSNKKLSQIPSGYSVLGWYGNSYLLLAKKNNLYIDAYQGGPNNPLLIGSYVGLNVMN